MTDPLFIWKNYELFLKFRAGRERIGQVRCTFVSVQALMAQALHATALPNTISAFQTESTILTGAAFRNMVGIRELTSVDARAIVIVFLFVRFVVIFLHL